ncbi:MAG: site-specific integrase, partial [Pseudoflavonifractor sp.]
MDYLKRYEAYLTMERKASLNTTSSYLRDIGQYLHWLEGEGLSPDQSEQEDIEHYVKYLSGKGKSVATITRSLASMKSFYGFLLGIGAVKVNPAKG